MIENVDKEFQMEKQMNQTTKLNQIISEKK